jgi:uncharacterized membrane protein
VFGRTHRPHVGERRERGVPGNERINALSDGVFAIVFTLLVFEFRVPDVPAAQLQEALAGLLPTILAYVTSFVVLGIYWIGQHNMFIHIKRHDRTFMWLTILFLLIVAAMPFPTGLLIRYGQEQITVIIYAATLAAVGFVLDLIWWYATHKHRLVDSHIDPVLVRTVHRRVLVAPLIYLLAIGVSFVSITLAKDLFFVVAILYIFPNLLDRYHHAQSTRHESATESAPTSEFTTGGSQ